MSFGYPLWRIKLTHEPTGISVETSSLYFRNQRAAYASCQKWLLSKVYAAGHGIVKKNEVIATYRLPDDYNWKQEIDEFRRNINSS